MKAFWAWLDHFFFCKWEIRGIQPMKMRTPSLLCFESMPPESVTQVLQRCKVCGRLRTKTLHGDWTWNDLVGEHNAQTQKNARGERL